MDLRQNPLHCDCEVKKWLENQYLTLEHMNETFCSTPEESTLLEAMQRLDCSVTEPGKLFDTAHLINDKQNNTL